MIKKVIFGFIIAILVFYFAGAIYKQLNSSCNSKRLPCQKEVVVFEKLYDKTMLSKVRELIEAGQYTLKVREQKSYYMKSKLFETLNLGDVQKCVQNTLLKYKKSLHVKSNSLHVDFLVYENDKLDPGKKTAKSKLYAGYIVVGFLIEGELIYKVQVDFMDMQGKDISQRVDCALQSLMTYNGEEK